jgi:protein-S-isoprenylcysteine O-methyltransferase Ste14
MPGEVAPPGTEEITSVPISRWWDRISVLPLVAWSLLGAAGFFIQIARQWPAADFAGVLRIASELSSLVFLVQQALLLCIRRPPVLRVVSVVARFWALVGAYLALSILLLPKAEIGASQALMSSILLLTGTAGSITALFTLGRSYAIFPQARMLKTGGLYRLVRHPLYVCEQTAFLGLALQFRQPWGVGIFLLSMAAQLPRMGYEEKVMEKAFPEYRAYAARTARLIPFLY